MNDKNLIGVSIVIPCFNRRTTITDCIKSVLDQEFQFPIEVIVSDDGSTDGTLEILKKFGSKIKVLNKPPEIAAGAASARNRGLECAKYNYIGFLDSDDYYLPGYIQTMYKTLRDNEELGYVFCKAKKEIIVDGKPRLYSWTRSKLSILDKKYHVLYRANVINTNVVFVRRDIIEKVGHFYTKLSNGQDSDMWIRISEVSRGKFVDIFGSVYRMNHSENQLTKVKQEHKNYCNYLIGVRALQRFRASGCDDKLRLLLIRRHLLYCKLTKREGFLFSFYRKAVVNLYLFAIFPLTFYRFLFLSYRS